ncbi:MAG: iron ABC transporter permease [Desulfurococcales archaeon]|nr:iron ABC transporter permease [Desulfurococcales archaeon]
MKPRRHARSQLIRLRLDAPIVAMLIIVILVFALFMIIPLASLIVIPIGNINFDILKSYLRYPYMTLKPLGESWILINEVDGVKHVIVTWKNYGIILNTLIAASLVTVFTSIIGITVALIMARMDFPGKTIMRILVIIPLLYTPFVNAFVIFKFFGSDGIISHILQSLGLNMTLEFQGLSGMILAQTMMFWPIVYLNVYSSMLQIDPSLEEQAENLGAKGFKLFRSVTLPLSLPGLASGAAIVFIFSMEDLAAPLAFKVDDVISMRIVREIQSSVSILELSLDAVILSLILLSMAAAWFIAVKRYVSLRQYAMIVRGGRWTPRLHKPSIAGYIAIYGILLPWVIFSAIPQIGVLVYAFTEEWIGVFPSGLTLDNFKYIFSEDVTFKGLRNSLTYATIAVMLIIIIGVSSAYVASRIKSKVAEPLDVLVTIPIAIPGLALATGMIILYGFGPLSDIPVFRYLNPVDFNPAVLLIMAYAVRRSPFTTRAIYAGLQQVSEALEEAAMNLGASRTRVLFSIVIPLIGINVFSGALISFVYSMAEVSTSITIGRVKPIDEGYAPMTAVMYDFLLGGYGAGNYVHIVSAMAALILSVQLLVIALTNIVLKQRYAFIGV